MAINWQDPEVKDRILAAIIGSFEQSVNCREVARLMGGEATYNAIENFMRKPKKRALELKAEAEAAGRELPVESPARPRNKPLKSTPIKGEDGILKGRVTKAKYTKVKAKGNSVKKEFTEEELFGALKGTGDDLGVTSGADENELDGHATLGETADEV